MIEQMKEAGVKIYKASQAFANSIRKHHEQSDWFEISNASAKIAFDNLEKGKSDFNDSLLEDVSREQIGKQLDELEKVAGKKLSEESRKAYIESNFLQMSQPNMGLGKADDSSKEWKQLNENPFLNPKLFVDSKRAGSKEQVLKNQALFQQEVDRSYGIFTTTQKQLLTYLEEKRTPENSTSIDNVKKRIETIRLTFASPAKPGGGCPGPNAFYLPEDHSFHLCPQIMQMPAESLKMIIAHELVHSIDSCTLSSDLLAVQGKKMSDDDSKMGGGADEEKRKQYLRLQREKNGIYDLIPKNPQPMSDTNYVVDDILGTVKPSLSHIYQNPKVAIEASGVPYDSHPFLNTLKCVQGQDSIGARATSVEDFTKSLDEKIKKEKATGATEQSSPSLVKEVQARAQAEEFMSKYGGCSDFSAIEGKSQLQEVFADKIALEVVARDLATKSPEERRAGVFESAGLFLAMACPNVGARVVQKTEAFLKEHKCGDYSNQNAAIAQQALQAQKRSKDEHPWEVDRIDRLLLAHPDLRRDLGCSGNSDVRYCQ
jgi:hypothetical protein